MASFKVRLRCPECETEYASDRLGLPEILDTQVAHVTVICVVCKKDFDATITPQPGVKPSWFQRVVMRQPVVPPGNNVAVTPRG